MDLDGLSGWMDGWITYSPEGNFKEEFARVFRKMIT